MAVRNVSCCLFFLIMCVFVYGQDIFVEAENFSVAGNGWKRTEGPVARSASGLAVLQGSSGAFDSTASDTVKIPEKGKWKIWVRYSQVPSVRGQFRIAVISGGKEIADKEFDLNPTRTRAADSRLGMDYVWDFLEADLPAGEITLKVYKTGSRAVHPYSRCLDCFLLTTNQKLVPDHTPYGPQIYLRVTIGDGHEKPFYIHIFADYYRSSWYANYSLTPDGLDAGVRPTAGRRFFNNGEKTDWISIAKLMYFDTGENLLLSPRYTYQEIAPRLKAKFEFATEPDEKKIFKTIERDAEPGGIHIIIPPDYASPEGAGKLSSDIEIAEATGKLADSMKWPSIGKKPSLFPFFASGYFGEGGLVPHDRKVVQRELKTLSYFGFCNREKTHTGGLWFMKNDCYCQPDIEKMKTVAKTQVETFRESGASFDSIAYCMLMDEPGGQPLSHIANCSACAEKFRQWVKQLNKTPADLMVNNWNEVRPVDETRRDTDPALYYFSEKFRTRALGDFMLVQKNILKDAWGTEFPTSPNFSDGATYVANFYAQGVDYFELLEQGGMNALWSENWGNGALTRESTTYNVELMRSAAIKNNQLLGHYLLVYAGRLAWDIKTIAVSQAARDVKIFTSFYYGPSWAGHEGGPPWNCSALYARPEKWYSQAELLREIGWAEDMLVPAKKMRSQVAIIYSSSSDIWDLRKNYAFGFERMFTWLALTHAQIPVDFVSEQGLEEKGLAGYRVCYFSGRNLTRAGAEKLRHWVKNGGILFLSAAAGSKDEYNRPLAILEDIMPAKRSGLQELQVFLSSGRYLDALTANDTVITRKDGTRMYVLSVKQALTPKPGAWVLATFSDSTPALVGWKVGRGLVYCAGFLPALAYARDALVARNELAKTVGKTMGQAGDIPDPADVATDTQLLFRSSNPWKYPCGIRNLLIAPVYEAKVDLPVRCNVPLVDAVAMECDRGLIMPVANYTLQPIKEVAFTVKTGRKVFSVESVHAGKIQFSQESDNTVRFTIPLKETDFVKIIY